MAYSIKMIPILAIFVILKWVGNRRMMSTAKCGGARNAETIFVPNASLTATEKTSI